MAQQYIFTQFYWLTKRSPARGTNVRWIAWFCEGMIMDTLHFYFIYSQQSMCLEYGQDIKIIPIYSVDDSIFIENQISYIRVGNFGNSSSSERFVR
jgi:hypothetical protein